jgi:hypothetical protein
MTAWIPRSGPLSIGERLMLARVADSYPCPLDTIRWIKQTSDSDGSEWIGECELEMRGWLRIRRRRRPGSIKKIEITGRAMRECPWLADPAARAKFVAEVRSSLVPEQVERRGAMEPDALVLLCGRIATSPSDADEDEGRRDLRRRAAVIFESTAHLAGGAGQALREALANGLDELARDLAAEVLGGVGEAALRTVLQQQWAEDWLDGVPVTVRH